MRLRPQKAVPALSADAAVTVHAGANELTSPTNLMSPLAVLGGASTPSRSVRAPTRKAAGTRPQHALDAAVDRECAQMRLTSAMPVRHWIREADVLKRQADQHHIAQDLEQQYIWCADGCSDADLQPSDVLTVRTAAAVMSNRRILNEFLPHHHATFTSFDDEVRPRTAQH